MIQPGRRGDNDTWADDAIMTTALELAVPLWQAQLMRYTHTGRRYRAQICAAAVAERGDILQYGVKTKKKNDTRVADVFNRLAEGLAIASFQPGGVTFAGLHWEIEWSDADTEALHDEDDAAMAAAVAVLRESLPPRPVVTLPPDPEGRL